MYLVAAFYCTGVHRASASHPLGYYQQQLVPENVGLYVSSGTDCSRRMQQTEPPHGCVSLRSVHGHVHFAYYSYTNLGDCSIVGLHVILPF